MDMNMKRNTTNRFDDVLEALAQLEVATCLGAPTEELLDDLGAEIELSLSDGLDLPCEIAELAFAGWGWWR